MEIPGVPALDAESRSKLGVVALKAVRAACARKVLEMYEACSKQLCEHACIQIS